MVLFVRKQQWVVAAPNHQYSERGRNEERLYGKGRNRERLYGEGFINQQSLDN